MAEVSTIVWIDASILPPTPEGGMNYFLVVTAENKPCYGAYYLNKYPLNYEDGCPDAEDGGQECEDCQNDNYHKTTGWHEETGDYDDSHCNPLESELYKVIAWAVPPIFKKVK